MINESKVVMAYHMIPAPIIVIIAILNAYIWHLEALSYFICGYNVAILVVASIMAIVSSINLHKSKKDVEEALQKLIDDLKKAQEKIENKDGE